MHTGDNLVQKQRKGSGGRTVVVTGERSSSSNVRRGESSAGSNGLTTETRANEEVPICQKQAEMEPVPNI
ncbi:predicted protein [Uncinocarpus reesii 1704]|uniref:Uncharacterized protein n=1 Tax=Uncinocarpus reesii (strain UAMH 1704) TaxID=336963 RepID=C4JVU0_UNCRE|nr:uncharacterized protein UREG_06682 [Uncinocarpus reesii 1704]EEP81817.1 predicted protein [Uncinocarpus reesii 1704]